MANIGGSVSTNPRGGHDISVQAAQGFKTDTINVSAAVIASGNTLQGPVTTVAFAGANVNGLGLSVQHAETPNIGSTFSQSAQVNAFKNDTHAINANAKHSRTHLDTGLKFERVGGNVGCQHQQGHTASAGVSRIPQFNMTTIEATRKANLWSSPNRATTLDLSGSASRNVSGPFAAKK